MKSINVNIISYVRLVLHNFSLVQAALFIFHLIIVFYLSVLSPFFVRNYFTTNFIEHEEPLEFTFRTCDVELHGICSFPEAVVYIGSVFFKIKFI